MVKARGVKRAGTARHGTACEEASPSMLRGGQASLYGYQNMAGYYAKNIITCLMINLSARSSSSFSH